MKTLVKLKQYKRGGLLIASELTNVPWFTLIPKGVKRLTLIKPPQQICQKEIFLISSVISVPWKGFSSEPNLSIFMHGSGSSGLLAKSIQGFLFMIG